MRYDDFIKSKKKMDIPTGIGVSDKLGGYLFPFQADLVRWSLRRGRAAIFADCGMGKTVMQLEFARHIPGRTLVIAPLAVAQQTVSEGSKFGIHLEYARHDIDSRIVVTNYEMMDHFNSNDFEAVVLDESSILKSYTGRFRNQVIESFKNHRFRLACTATPAPNDWVELGNHAEFLGVCSRVEMLATYFVHDGGETQKWRLKGHARGEFWRWVATWAACVRDPTDLGYPHDRRFDLPPIKYHEHTIGAHPTSGYLFAMEAQTLQDRQRARRETVGVRVARCAQLVAQKPHESWIIWCGLNAESAQLKKAIPGAVEVKGSDTHEQKRDRLSRFSSGDIRVLVSKPSIAGFGLNWQHCSHMAFVGLSDSWEKYYQAMRRCWRFGQKREVHVYIITSELEGSVVANIKRKSKDAAIMATEMVSNMRDFQQRQIQGFNQAKGVEVYEKSTITDHFEMHHGDCVEVVGRIKSDTIGYSIFSPPFASLYTYSASDRDMGNCSGYNEFFDHFKFLCRELFRVLIPGRLLSFHCMLMPTLKSRDGFIGLYDFRGDLIRAFQAAGMIYHSEVVIWKDPVTAMQRTKALGLLHKQIKKDSCMSRQGIPDYLVTMRKPGKNPVPVSNTNQSFPVGLWQQYASPIWMDIKPNDTIQYRSAREHEDERHICPLQLEVIRRALKLWTTDGDIVLSPFAGIGSEGYCAVEAGRRFVGAELKRSYYRQAVRNINGAVAKTKELTLF